MLHIDFETKSCVGLEDKSPGVGMYNYSRHPTTGVYCMGYAWNGKPEVWTPAKSFPEDVKVWVRHGGAVAAFNAPFELAIWNGILRRDVPDVPVLRPSQTFCVRAIALRMGFPGHLDGAVKAARLEVEKDNIGKALMLRLCKPTNKGDWLLDRDTFTFMGKKITPEEALETLYSYCAQDVVTERALTEVLLPLPATERALWLEDYAINARGIQIDLDAVTAALELVDRRRLELNQEMQAITGGAVQATTEVGKLKTWMGYTGSLDKKIIAAKLEYGDSRLKPEHMSALELRSEASRLTSLTKVDAMRRLSCPKGRVRNTTQYHKASTGRWGGQGLQTHNFPRDMMPDPDVVDELFAKLKAGEPVENPVATLSKALRGFFVAPEGRVLIGGDWSNIEGRMLAWLAGEDWKVQAFRDYDAGTGPDVYIKSYAEATGCSIEEATPMRQAGKQRELAGQYQGGPHSMFTWGFDGTEGEALTAIRSWRKAHPQIVSYWYSLQRAAISAVEKPGTMFPAGPPERRIRYRMDKRHGVPYLQCRLPSGRQLYYPYPEVRVKMEKGKPKKDRYGKEMRELTYMTVPNPLMKEKFLSDPHRLPMRWERVSTYGGKQTNNVTQACARDVLRDLILNAREYKHLFRFVGHTHDEGLVEAPKHLASEALHAYNSLMNQPVWWAKDLPLAAECWVANRYRKS